MFITNTNKFNYQLLQLHTLIMHFDPFRKYFQCSVGGFLILKQIIVLKVFFY
jgi:hypothetical protein